jgi:lipoprotein-anchoring transpeptidase ErfK/SrfK
MAWLEDRTWSRLSRTAFKVGLVLICAMEALPQASEAGERWQPFRLIPPAAITAAEEADADSVALPARLQRQVVTYKGTEARGTVIIDTSRTYLYYVLGDGKALRYGVGVGREGFTWSGRTTVAQKAEWPDWIPPAEMLQRQPYLPRLMAGGPGNPLGARAIYLGSTLYRIHGTNVPSSIGKHISSGCIRMLNDDVIDLYARVHIGTPVIVLPSAIPMS